MYEINHLNELFCVLSIIYNVSIFYLVMIFFTLMILTSIK